MPPITTVIPTQQQLQQIHNSPTSLLAMYQQANTPAPAAGSPAAVTAAGTSGIPGAPGSNLNNLNNPDWMQSMTEMLNQINLKAQQEANAARIPNATGLEQKSSEDIGAALRGELPNDVVTQMAQRSAERGVFTGNPAGASTTADLMRSIGLNSLQLQGQGQDWLTAALGRNPAAPLANPQALVTTPAQAEALALQRQNMELDYLARMAAINAGRERTRSGYGGGSGGYPRTGGGGGGFAPTTNWQGGSGNPVTTPWHLPYSLGGDQISDEEWGNMLYGYPEGDTTQTATPSPTQDGGWGAFDVNPVSYNPDLYPDFTGGGINTGGMGQDELDWLYNVGGG